ncbi:MAG: LD-carboxypeptidase [Synechococcaceae bacterium WB7_3xG_012]|jgi:muramoyltetrapeptide carboxypeptidase|uniref:S66 peptidase family protein n=1 Tax=unclassified Vulcanococcus TaxID=2766969 RepID=UPI0025E83DB8|nr:LD-carboxypeptidase [Vulcanococcus sp. DEBay_Sum29NL08_54]NCV92323.1 LD-carboxypeptidase [Synechococcaceae bacterium WB7_3xG_012]
MNARPWPRPLQAGDRVQLAAASSALQGDAISRLEAGIVVLERWGLEVEPHRNLQRHWGYYAGTDPERLEDLQPNAPLVACMRGGWGSARLLERPLAAEEHWLLGFSDVTSLLWARQAAGLPGGIHGPMVTTLGAEPEWSQERLRALLFGEALPPLQGTVWNPGQAEGPCLAGNLTVATHLLGTPHLPDLSGAILLFEDIGEAPYRIDRMLSHWRLSGALQQIAGLGFGSFSDCEGDEDDARDPQHSFGLQAVLQERCGDLGIPVIADLPFGHRCGNAAIPIGRRARLDGERGQLLLL